MCGFGCNCGCGGAPTTYVVSSGNGLSVVSGSNTLLALPLNMQVAVTSYSLQQMTLPAAPPLPDQPSPVTISYPGLPGGALVVAVTAAYDESLDDFEYLEHLQWRFVGSSDWNVMGPSLVLTGTIGTSDGTSNQVQPIEILSQSGPAVSLTLLVAG